METKFFWGAGKIIRLAFLLAVLIACIKLKVIANEIPRTGSQFPSISLTFTESPLSEFRSEVNEDRKITLRWKTTVTVSCTYEVEKSKDGENFSPVKGKAIRSEGDNQFTWIDEDSKKFINCYRLKITDATGKVSYSRTMVVNLFKSGEVVMVGVTPDISVSEILVNVKLEEQALITFNITDKSGKILKQKKAKATAGMNDFSVEGTGDLKPGEYFLNVIVNGTDRLMVQLVKE